MTPVPLALTPSLPLISYLSFLPLGLCSGLFLPSVRELSRDAPCCSEQPAPREQRLGTAQPECRQVPPGLWQWGQSPTGWLGQEELRVSGHPKTISSTWSQREKGDRDGGHGDLSAWLQLRSRCTPGAKSRQPAPWPRYVAMEHLQMGFSSPMLSINPARWLHLPSQGGCGAADLAWDPAGGLRQAPAAGIPAIGGAPGQ